MEFLDPFLPISKSEFRLWYSARISKLLQYNEILLSIFFKIFQHALLQMCEQLCVTIPTEILSI